MDMALTDLNTGAVRRQRPSLRERWAERGFSTADLLNLWAPVAGERHEGLAYGPAPRQRLDVYRPRHARGAPLLVFFYGGSWQRGSRDLYPFLGGSLAAQGIVTVVPDYALFPAARFPEFLQDSARAVAFARAHAHEWGADPERLILMGHSAGAYNAAMLTFDRQWLAAKGLNAQRDVAGFVGLAGPYDFLPIRGRILQRIFGGASRPETQPITFVTGCEAPSLLIAAKRDTLVDPGNSERLAAKVRDLGGRAEVRLYPRVNHYTLIGSFAPALRVLAPTMREVADFIWRTTARPKRAAAG
jgi:acetyl esterase/lipase